MFLLQHAFRSFRKQWKYNLFIILEITLLISLSLVFFNLPIQLIQMTSQFLFFFGQDALEWNLSLYAGILFFIFLPILGIGIFFLRNLIHIKLAENLEEIRKLKQNGYAQSQISHLYFTETLICASIAGVLAIVMGEYLIQITEYQLKFIIFPEGEATPFHFFWMDAFSFKNILFVLGFSILFSVLVSQKVISRILNLKIDQIRSPTRFNPEWSPGFQFIFRHIIGISLVTIFPFLFIWLMDLLNIDLLDTLFNFTFFIGLFLALVFTPVFCVLFPLLITHFSIKLLFRVIESKLTTSSQKYSPKNWHIFYSFKSLARQKHLTYFQFIFLVLTFNLLIFGVNYQQIENDYFDRKELYLTGNGQYVGLDFTQPHNQSTIQNFSQHLNSFKSSLQFAELFRYDHIQDLSLYFNPDLLNWTDSGIVLDYSMYDSIPDDWFVDTTYQHIKEQASKETFVICPMMYKTMGYHVGDSLDFRFTNTSFDVYAEDANYTLAFINLTIPIRGFYHIFPLVDSIPSSTYNPPYLFNNYTHFTQVNVYSMDLIFTSVSIESVNFYSSLTQILADQSLLYIKQVEFENPTILAWNSHFGQNSFFFERMSFHIMSYFIIILLGLVLLNLGVSIYLDNRKFQPESRFLYSRGVPKPQIFQIYLIQFLFYGLLALILSWCSLGPLYSIVTLRNILSSPLIPLFARTWQIDIGMSVVSLILVFVSYTALFLLTFVATRKSFFQIEKSKNL